MAKIDVEAGTTRLTIEVAPGERLLTQALTHPARPVPFGCRKGVCGTCLSQVLEGWEALEPAGPAERELLETLGVAEGMRLACQLIVRGDARILPVGIRRGAELRQSLRRSRFPGPDKTTDQTSLQKG